MYSRSAPRRRHGAEFKAKVLAACDKPGASIRGRACTWSKRQSRAPVACRARSQAGRRDGHGACAGQGGEATRALDDLAAARRHPRFVAIEISAPAKAAPRVAADPAGASPSAAPFILVDLRRGPLHLSVRGIEREVAGRQQPEARFRRGRPVPSWPPPACRAWCRRCRVIAVLAARSGVAAGWSSRRALPGARRTARSRKGGVGSRACSAPGERAGVLVQLRRPPRAAVLALGALSVAAFECPVSEAAGLNRSLRLGQRNEHASIQPGQTFPRFRAF